MEVSKLKSTKRLNNLHTEALIVFLKSLDSDRVKTRLAADLGQTDTLLAYKAMIADLRLNLLALKQPVIPYLDRFQGKESLPWVKQFDQEPRLQQGRGLGERMRNALEEVLTKKDRVLLIGADIPNITAGLIDDYFEKLRRFPMVLGPAVDGGYYLIGFRRHYLRPELFRNIDWSSERVFRQTLEKADSLGLSCYTGPELQDIDTLADLLAVAENSGQILPALNTFVTTRSLKCTVMTS